MAKPKSTDVADPNKLVRQEAGTYRTPDDRFEVREAGTGWFLVDSEQANEFGQELVQGPFATLKAVRETIPEARRTAVKPMRPRKASKASDTPPKPKAKPRGWIDRLPKADAASVRSLIRAVERDGLTDAEQLVRTDREGLGPAIATRLIERRLEEIVTGLPAKDRAGARKLAGSVARLLAADGTAVPGPLPGWTLVEIGPEPEPSNRRIILRE